MRQENRINEEPAFVLHSWPYRETSLLLDVFSRHHGRLPIVARGARRPKSELRGVLLAFQPVSLSWFGKGEVKTLHAAEWQGGMPQLSGRPLLCAFYINELLQRLLHRDDAHEPLFDVYGQTLARLAGGEDAAVSLRCFELRLLAELGYGLRLDEDIMGAPISAGASYQYLPEQGPLLVDTATTDSLKGQTLLDCAASQFSSPQTLAQAKRLLRLALHQQLGMEPLRSRQLLLDWPDA